MHHIRVSGSKKIGPAEEIYGNSVMLYSPRVVKDLAYKMTALWADLALNEEMRTLAIERSNVFSRAACARGTANVLESF